MDAFDRIAARTPKETKRIVSKMLDVADRIHELLEAKGMSQKDLAKALGKSESEISKWLTGTHNLELKTIARIEEALGEDILAVPKVEKKQFKPIAEGSLRYYGGPLEVRPHIEVMPWPAMTEFVFHQFSEHPPRPKSMLMCRFNSYEITLGMGVVPKASVGQLQQRVRDIFNAWRQYSVNSPEDELTLIEIEK